MGGNSNSQTNTMTKLAAIVGSALFGVSSLMAQQLGVDFTGPIPDTTGIGFWGYTLGYDFQVVTPVTVVGLAAYDDNLGPGLTQSVPVGLWNAAGTLIASATIAKGTTPSLGAADFFAETGIKPITLEPGYYTVAADDDWVQSLNQLPNFTVAPGINYVGYAQTPSPVASFTYPTLQVASGTSEEALFGGNIVLGTASAPDGGLTIVMLGMAASGMAFFRRKL